MWQPVYILAIRNIFISEVFWLDGRITVAQFQKGTAENILPIYGECGVFVKTVKPHHIHTLYLQLVAVTFVEDTVPNKRLVGTRK